MSESSSLLESALKMESSNKTHSQFTRSLLANTYPNLDIIQNGWPDFLLTQGGRKMTFVELKVNNQPISSCQNSTFNVLRKYGFDIRLAKLNTKKRTMIIKPFVDFNCFLHRPCPICGRGASLPITNIEIKYTCDEKSIEVWCNPQTESL